MFINIAICEDNTEKIKTLHHMLTELSIQDNCDIQLFWFYSGNKQENISTLTEEINLALISLDIEAAGEIGRKLYAANPACLILYYKQTQCDLEPVLNSRPMAFHKFAGDEQALKQKIQILWNELKTSREIFRCETKNMVCLLPYANIIYFESDYKHVLIHTKSGKIYRIFKKLNDIQAEIKLSGFLRVHQSYLVNSSCIESIDKSDHGLFLTDGEKIYISKAYYEPTLIYLAKQSITTSV